MKRKLGEICRIVSGSTPNTGIPEYWDGDLKWITPAELDDKSRAINDTKRTITELGATKTGLTSLPAGTVLLSSRAPIGKVAITDCEMYCNQGSKNLICSDSINNKYLYWFLKGKTRYLNSLGRGATFKEISKKIVADIEINLPDIEEQEKIVNRIEKIDSRLFMLRTEISRLDELIKARFVEMFERNNSFDKLGNLAHFIKTGKLDANAEEKSGLYPFFTCDATPKTINTYAFDMEAILISGNGSRVGHVHYYSGKFNAYQRTYVIGDFNKNIDVVFLKKYLEVELRPYISKNKKGSAVPYITLPMLQNFAVPVPKIEYQKQFAAFVAQVDKSKFAVQKSLEKTQLLFDSLMQEYFG